MAKKLTMYECSYCSHTLKTEKGIKKHEASCKQNPNILDITKNIEDIRCTSKSVQEVVKRVQDYLLTLGIKLHLTSYPDEYSEKVSNSHNSPKDYPSNWVKDPSKPTSYPGWEGRWEGEVEVVDKSILGTRDRNVYFSDVIRGGLNENLLLDFFHTGSGGGGEKFSFSGIMFVYDFPKIHETYIANGGAVSDLSHHYSSVIDNYYDKYDDAINKKIKSDYVLCKLKSLTRSSTVLVESLRNSEYKALSNIQAKFNEDYKVKLPLPPDAFSVSDKARDKIKNSFFSVKAQPHPSLKKYTEQLNVLLKEMEELKQNNPEYFL